MVRCLLPFAEVSQNFDKGRFHSRPECDNHAASWISPNYGEISLDCPNLSNDIIQRLEQVFEADYRD